MNAHDLAAQFTSEIRWEALPQPVRDKVKLTLVDNLGATLVGTLCRASQIAADYAPVAWPGEQASILLNGKRANAAGAAFANGVSANGVDIDDSARYAYGHAGAQIFPTALAVAEAKGLSGADLLCGMVVGYEVAHRVGRCWHASRDVYQACGSWGSVACAAAAAHLMRLSPEQAGHALGIAEYHAPNAPMMRDVDNPGMVKHAIGWAAMSGVVAAELASRGFTGIPSILAFPEYQEWGLDIGSDYLMVEGVAFKETRYACCGWAHAGVEGARLLVERHEIQLDQIAEILVEGSEATARLLTDRLPSTTEEAQFSQSWPLAAMLVDGEIGPQQMLENRLADPVIRALAAKVKVVATEEMQDLCDRFERGDPTGRFASRVTITLNDGNSYNSGLVDGGLRFPQPGWDRDRMSTKFRWLAGHIWDQSRVEGLLPVLWEFDRLATLGSFIELVA